MACGGVVKRRVSLVLVLSAVLGFDLLPKHGLTDGCDTHGGRQWRCEEGKPVCSNVLSSEVRVTKLRCCE